MNQSARSMKERKVWIISTLPALTGEQSVLGRQNDTNVPTYCRDSSIRPAKPDAVKHGHYPTSSPCSDSMPTSYLLITRLPRTFFFSEGMGRCAGKLHSPCKVQHWHSVFYILFSCGFGWSISACLSPIKLWETDTICFLNLWDSGVRPWVVMCSAGDTLPGVLVTSQPYTLFF